MGLIYAISFYIIIFLIFVNGMTDAPNAIATLVETKTMKFRKAAIMSAIFDVLGIIVMIRINTSVADCISSLVDLGNSNKAIIALLSGMAAVIIFSLISIRYGIPTSESHGLVAGLTGSAIAIGGLSSVNYEEWKNILVGLGWSIVGTLVFAFFIYNLFIKLFRKFKNQKIKIAQIASACGISFMHGAQDGLKFIGILIIYNSIATNKTIPLYIDPSQNIWIIILCATVLGLGVGISTNKIVKMVGSNVSKLNNDEALCSDLTTIFILLFASLNRLPISTSHVKTVSVLGVGRTAKKEVQIKNIKDIFMTWICTFPVCGIIAYLLTTILTNIYV